MTDEAVETEYWACYYAESDATEEYEDDDFDARATFDRADDAPPAAEDEWEDVINARD